MFFSSLRVNCVTIIGVIIVIVNRANLAVIIVRKVLINSFLFYCLLLNHSFPTNPNSITNCFQLILFYLQLYKLHLLNAFVYFWFLKQSGDLKRQPGFSMYESFEATVNTALNGAMQNAGQAASDSLNRHNNFKATVSSGSKGK